jgi:regulator of sigma E protease
LSAVLILTALLSINLGILNLLPIPALDGGHIIFNLYELITRKKANPKVVIYLTAAGWIILLSLMIFTVYNDIDRFFLHSKF